MWSSIQWKAGLFRPILKNLGFLKTQKTWKVGILGFLFFKSKFLLFQNKKSVNLYEFVEVAITSLCSQ